jgi:cytosine/adenosine deaminase-related metal-dependent hydrolase
MRPGEAPEVTHRADWVVVDPQTVIRNGWVRTGGGKILEVGSGGSAGKVRDYGAAALLPVLVNAHTHLELCPLGGKIGPGRAFTDWIRTLLALRDGEGKESIRLAAGEGIHALTGSGCGLVGEISSLGITWDLLAASPLSGVWFREFVGVRSVPEPESDAERSGLIRSVAGHGPHTLSPEKLTALKKETTRAGRPFSIHVSESVAEVDFISGRKGEWTRFLTERNVDYSGWSLRAGSPVRYLDALGILDADTIAVHLVHMTEKDREIVSRCGARACLCPRSNQNLHGSLPDLPALLRAGIRPCLGTDSLASVDSLSIFDEMAFTAAAFPGIDPREILAMGTCNGADALGFSGTLAPGAAARMLRIGIEAAQPSKLIEILVNSGGTLSHEIIR